MVEDFRRRAFLIGGASALVAAGCRKPKPSSTEVTSGALPGARSGPDHEKIVKPRAEAHSDEEGEVSAVEDLMREHGVIRRALIVYRASAARLRETGERFPMGALKNAAKLVRSFAEDYHERALEETHLFPALRRAGGAAAGDVETLIAQHQRGREITEYVLAASRRAPGPTDIEPLARALESFARMYEAHAAREDTVVFPAWKKLLSPRDLDEMGERFEEIEHRTFGRDGFDEAVSQIASVERALGLDFGAQTAPPPPRR